MPNKTRIKILRLSVLILFLGNISSQPCLAGNPPNPFIDRYLQWLNSERDELQDFAYIPKNKETKISFHFNQLGEIEDPKFLKSSGDKAFDIACLELVCTLPPYGRISEVKWLTNKENNTEIHFKEKHLKVSNKLNRLHIQARKNGIFLHLIPLTVLNIYPRTFNPGELKSPNNLLLIGSLTGKNANDDKLFNSTVKLVKLTSRAWYRFYRNHKTASKNEIIEHANKIMKGKFVLEPVTVNDQNWKSELTKDLIYRRKGDFDTLCAPQPRLPMKGAIEGI